MEEELSRLEAIKEAIIGYEPSDKTIVITKTEVFLDDMKWLLEKAEIGINSKQE